MTLQDAKAEALERLIRIVRESTNETQARLAATAILRLPDPEPATETQAADEADPADGQQVSPQPRTSPRPPLVHAFARTTPLTAKEIAEVRRLFPELPDDAPEEDLRLRYSTHEYWKRYWKAPPITPAQPPPDQQRVA